MFSIIKNKIQFFLVFYNSKDVYQIVFKNKKQKKNYLDKLFIKINFYFSFVKILRIQFILYKFNLIQVLLKMKIDLSL